MELDRLDLCLVDPWLLGTLRFANGLATLQNGHLCRVPFLLNLFEAAQEFVFLPNATPRYLSALASPLSIYFGTRSCLFRIDTFGFGLTTPWCTVRLLALGHLSPLRNDSALVQIGWLQVNIIAGHGVVTARGRL